MRAPSRFQSLRLAALTISTALFPFSFYYLSPVVPLYGSSLGIVTGSLLVFGFLTIAALFLGRSFCSWLCPIGGLQDQIARSRTKRLPVERIAWLKFLVWGLWLAGLLYFFRQAGGIKGVSFAFATESGLSTTSVPALIAYGIVVLTFIGLGLVFGRRAGCQGLCWIAPFMILGRRAGRGLKLPSLELATKSELCPSCGRCAETCPMSLDVPRLVQTGGIRHDECILCGLCRETCPRKVIDWSWGRSPTKMRR